MIKTTSYAVGSNKVYYLAMVRTVANRLKFQVRASGRVNREYGASFVADSKGTLFVQNAIHEQTLEGETIESLAPNSDERYIRCQFRLPSGTNKIHFQVEMGTAHNRHYGLAFSIYQIGLHKSLRAYIMKYCQDNSTLQQINKGMLWSMKDQAWVKKDSEQAQDHLVWSKPEQTWIEIDEYTETDTPTKADWDHGNVNWSEAKQKWVKGGMVYNELTTY